MPGGTLSQEGEGPYKTDACIFNAPDDINLEIMKSWEQVFIKLMRRYKYLEKIFQVCFFFVIMKHFGESRSTSSNTAIIYILSFRLDYVDKVFIYFCNFFFLFLY